MRSFLIAFSLLASVVSKAGTPNSDKVSNDVLHSFETTFMSAQEVSWTVSSTMYKAAFTFNGQHVTAFYSNEGNLIAVTRNITSAQLPIKLQTSLKCSEKGWISDLFEVSNDEGTSYYVTIEDADRKIVLKSNGDASWSVYEKTEKI